LASKLAKAICVALILAAAALLAGYLKRRHEDSPDPFVEAPEPPSAERPTGGMSRAQLDGATREQLYEEAKRRGVPGRSTMTKAQLQAALMKELDR
jgi:hypothetical protein